MLVVQRARAINENTGRGRNAKTQILDGRHGTARAARTNTYGGNTDAVINDDFREMHKGWALSRRRIQRELPNASLAGKAKQVRGDNTTNNVVGVTKTQGTYTRNKNYVPALG